ncbi:MAG: phosphatidylglycerol lysyltransferase domain-containing protein [Tissierellia bacterium]|nr:phosphatidylglycerol lysyltransferase domain-containing protein [Tissierellia bacterium]
MLNFKKIELEDKEWIIPILRESVISGCHQNFGNLFAWREINDTKVAKVNDFLVAKQFISNVKDIYLYPMGKGDVKPVIEEIIRSVDKNLIFAGLSPEEANEMDELYPGRFIYDQVRDDYDYIYLLEKMVSLKGKKLHRKRNHLNAFIRNNLVWTFETITEENKAECIEMNKKWCIDIGCKDDKSLMDENCATKYFLKYFNELELQGGLIRVDNEVVAYTIGEVLNTDTYVVHIEKAFKDVQGAYPMINQQFAAWVQEKYPHLIYINREEDMGMEGLRKAKLSYYPDKMAVKYRAVLK